MTDRLGTELHEAVLDRAAGQQLLAAMQDEETYAATISSGCRGRTTTRGSAR